MTETVLDVGTGTTAWPHLCGLWHCDNCHDNMHDYCDHQMVNCYWILLDVDISSRESVTAYLMLWRASA